MKKKLIVSPSPHIHDNVSTHRLMHDVIIALMPAFLASGYFFGSRVILLTAISVGACVGFEWLIQKYLLKGRSTIGDLSAVVTGLLLALNLPANIPLHMIVLGALVSIGVAKMTFGGLGNNPFNPAIVGRIFLLISFPTAMTSWPKPGGMFAVDGSTGATPLAIIKQALAKGENISEIMTQYDFGYLQLLWGQVGGSVGEVSAIALMLGFAYLLIRRVITWHIPITIFATVLVFAGILHKIDPSHYVDPLFHLLSGGLLLGAIFMATDYVTSPMTKRGMLIYAIGIALLTIIIRTWGSYPEGISFAILIMNAVVPLINSYIKPKRFGEVKQNG